MTTIHARIQIKRDLALNWTEKNPILLDGEQGYEKDTGKMKIGDGVRRWRELPYFNEQEPLTFDGGQPATITEKSPVFDMGGVQIN